jgi:ferritin-like metal-binding protein YciE
METKTKAKKATVKKTATPKTATSKTPAKTISKTPAKTQAKIPAKKNAAKELKDLFEDSLKDIYWAEKALTKALPKMYKNATDKKLQSAIELHLAETHVHVKRLEECFASLGKKAQAKKCDAMQGLLDEGKSIMEETEPGAVRDAGIIAAAQKVEHYEIATYGTLAAFAKILKEKTCLKNLLATLHEEKICDQLLTKVADINLNSKALKK